ENLRRNRIQNVRALNQAAADAAGRVRLFHGPEHNSGETSTVAAPGFAFEGEVQARPLSAMLTPEEIGGARCIKIDVEGAECSVAAGMEPLLRSGRADLEVIVEVHPEQLVMQGKQPEDLIATFAQA